MSDASEIPSIDVPLSSESAAQPGAPTPSDAKPVAAAAAAAAKKPMKKANKPFLVHQRWLAKQRAEKERDPHGLRSSRSSSVGAGWSVIKWILLALVTSGLMSRSVTGTFGWGYEGKWSRWSNIKDLIIPGTMVHMSEQQLAMHDGSDPRYPVYVALDGEVFDVSAGTGASTYGPGGSYSIFAGKDAARAFVTGCFKTHLTYDLRGLTEKELGSLRHWKKFYTEHKHYKKVGTVAHPPIDPSVPLPEPCNAKAEGGAI